MRVIKGISKPVQKARADDGQVKRVEVPKHCGTCEYISETRSTPHEPSAAICNKHFPNIYKLPLARICEFYQISEYYLRLRR